MEYFYSMLFFILLAWGFIWTKFKRSPPPASPLPPGPTPLFLVGNLFSIGDKAHKSLTKLAQIHGPIMTVKLGQVNTVVISSATVAKEIMQKHDLTFCDRHISHGATAANHHIHSVVLLPVSPLWRNMRRIMNSHIFTVQKLNLRQDLRRQKVQDLLETVRKSSLSGTLLDIGQEAFTTTLNLLSNTFLSVDLANPSSKTPMEYRQIFRAILAEVGTRNLADFFPILGCLDIQGIRRRLAKHSTNLTKIVESFINNRLVSRRKLEAAGGPRPANDVLDVLLNIHEDNEEEISMMAIIHLILDIFSAGTDTTSITVEWAMAELIHNPIIMSKAREEIYQVIGKGNQVDESNISSLPYLQAIVKETLRLHPTNPFLVPRKAKKDVEVLGYMIPKDSQIFVNVWAIGRDPNNWYQPESFIPERFLGSEIDVKGRHFELVPFGAGRRMCPGAPLALRMIPLVLATLIQSFNWKIEGNVAPQDMDMEDKFGFSLRKAMALRAIPIPM